MTGDLSLIPIAALFLAAALLTDYGTAISYAASAIATVLAIVLIYLLYVRKPTEP